MYNDKLSAVFGALASPTRRALLIALTSGPISVGDLARPFQMTEPAVIKHLKVLENAGLIVSDRRGQVHPRMLNAAPLKNANVWIERFSQHWSESFDRLDVLLAEMQKKETPRGRKKKSRA